jgi:hypothetical protein
MKRGIPCGELPHLGDSHRETRPAPPLGRFAGRAALACQAACDIIEEALDASHMVRVGYSLDRIRAEIDRKYGR